jgi:beta-lactam-binding protein with PASTA domain
MKAALCFATFLLACPAFSQVVDNDVKGRVESQATVTVPGVVGILGGKGRTALEKAGLKWEYAPQGIPTKDPNQNAIIAKQAPAAGQKVRTGSTVVLTLYIFVEPKPDPDAKGKVKLPPR